MSVQSIHDANEYINKWPVLQKKYSYIHEAEHLCWELCLVNEAATGVVLTDESLCRSPWLEYTASIHPAEMQCDQLQQLCQIIGILWFTLYSTKVLLSQISDCSKTAKGSLHDAIVGTITGATTVLTIASRQRYIQPDDSANSCIV